MFSLQLILFALVCTGTPGPNNIMILTSSVNFGIKRTIAHWLGIITGVPLMMGAIGLGLFQIFNLLPTAFFIIKILGVTYLLYLAYKITVSDGSAKHSTAKPMSYIQGLLFQWINPKAWIMSIAAITTFSNNDASFFDILIISLTFLWVGFFGVGSWLFLGAFLESLLQNTFHRKIFNISMAFLLVISILPMLQSSMNTFI